MFRDHGYTTTTKSLLGRPAQLLLEEAKALGADLTAVGSRGLGRRRALVGSVSDHVARHASAALVARRLVVEARDVSATLA
jgi:nucleotide-binding universal stress UspA family protein